MTAAPVTFGESLRGPENEALRARVAALAAAGDRPLVVDSVLAMFEALARDDTARRRGASFLIFDVQRLFLYDEPLEDEGAAAVDSMVRFIVDGYPFQPFDLLRQHLRGQPYRFLYPLESLDVLPLLWSSRQPGRVTALDLTTAEIETAELAPHPESSPSRWIAAPTDLETGLARRSLRLADCWTDASLRCRPAADLEGLISRPAGVVREKRAVRDFMSLPFATTLVTWNQGQQKELCYGKSARASAASSVALCEALERFQVAFRRPSEELVYGSYRELSEAAVDPRSLFFGRRAGEDGDDPVFDEETPMYWTWADPPRGGEAVLVPAQEVWFKTSQLPGETVFIQSTTNGCALGSSVEEASLHALLEAIERDSYLTMWYLRRPCARIDPDSIEDESFQVLRHRWALAFPDYDSYLFDITAELAIPTVAAVAVRRRGRGPRTFHGAAARLSTGRACYAALQDVSGFSPEPLDAARRADLRRLLDEPERLSGPSDHFELYALDETFERLAFLGFEAAPRIDARDLDRRSLIPIRERYNLRAVLERLAEHAAPRGVAIYLKDITHPWLAERGLHCVKAVTPGLYPIWFGSRNRRFAVTDRLRRLAVELTGRRPVSAADFNLEVHPFS